MSAPWNPETTPEEYRQRALLLADLGRYDEAAEEIAAGLAVEPDEPSLLATLARIHLAADQPAEALVAADRAAATTPAQLPSLVVRAMALTDSGRYADAARVAGDILRQWPGDAYAQRTGAALLSESRNGQEALNAAWDAVRLAPADAEAHLVLAVVSARLRLFDLAQRAYGQALDLDAGLSDAQRDVGIVRLERRRWAQALEGMADEAALGTADAAPDFPRRPRAEPPDTAETFDPSAPAEPPERSVGSGPADPSGHSGPAEPSVGSGPADLSGRSGSADPSARSARSRPQPAGYELPPVVRPSEPVLDPSEDSAAALRQAVLYGANGTVVAAVLTGAMTTASAGAARVWAGMIGILLLVAVPIWLSRRLTEPLSSALARLRTRDRRRAAVIYAALVAPVFVVLYAVIGGPALLIAAVVVAAAAETLFLLRRS